MQMDDALKSLAVNVGGKRIRKTNLCIQSCSHMGHIFKGERFNTPTNERHCVNSVSIQFQPSDEPKV